MGWGFRKGAQEGQASINRRIHARIGKPLHPAGLACKSRSKALSTATGDLAPSVESAARLPFRVMSRMPEGYRHRGRAAAMVLDEPILRSTREQGQRVIATISPHEETEERLIVAMRAEGGQLGQPADAWLIGEGARVPTSVQPRGDEATAWRGVAPQHQGGVELRCAVTVRVVCSGENVGVTLRVRRVCMIVADQHRVMSPSQSDERFKRAAQPGAGVHINDDVVGRRGLERFQNDLRFPDPVPSTLLVGQDSGMRHPKRMVDCKGALRFDTIESSDPTGRGCERALVGGMDRRASGVAQEDRGHGGRSVRSFREQRLERVEDAIVFRLGAHRDPHVPSAQEAGLAGEILDEDVESFDQRAHQG